LLKNKYLVGLLNIAVILTIIIIVVFTLYSDRVSLSNNLSRLQLNFLCTGRKPQKQDIRILDAGCGSGVGTEYLVHLNPQAQVVGIDLSAGTLEVAKRCESSGADRVEFHHLSIFPNLLLYFLAVEIQNLFV